MRLQCARSRHRGSTPRLVRAAGHGNGKPKITSALKYTATSILMTLPRPRPIIAEIARSAGVARHARYRPNAGACSRRRAWPDRISSVGFFQCKIDRWLSSPAGLLVAIAPERPRQSRNRTCTTGAASHRPCGGAAHDEHCACRV
jgi:hypothetical protein